MKGVLRFVLFILFGTLFVAEIDAFPNRARFSRGGTQPTDCNCNQVFQSIPPRAYWVTQCAINYGLHFYKIYAMCYGIPILASKNKDAAVSRYCYMVKFLLGENASVRARFFRNCGRTAVIGQYEGTTSIPEHAFLGGSWNTRARGLGGTLSRPVSSAGEENLLCRSNDRYRVEDIGLHEFVHGIVNLGTGMASEINRAFTSAKYRGLWRNTYSLSSWEEYFAEGAQSFFNTNPKGCCTRAGNGIHNDIATRAQLQTYDPTLYALVLRVWPQKNCLVDRCQKKSASTTCTSCNRDTGYCSAYGTGTDTGGGGTKEKEKEGGGDTCIDSFGSACEAWAKNGECTKNVDWMGKNCEKSCNTCKKTVTKAPVTKAPVTQKPTQKPDGTCVDLQDFCPFIKDYCKSNTYTKVNCKNTCVLCPKPPPPKPKCNDTNESCVAWAKAGYCNEGSYKKWMTENCSCACTIEADLNL